MSDARLVRAHDRLLSLWQSAAAETVRTQLVAAGAEETPTTAEVNDHPLMDAVNDHVEIVLERGLPLDPPPPDAPAEEIRAFVSHLALERAKALVEGDEARADDYRDWIRKYSDYDLLFAECEAVFLAYFEAHHGKFKYNDWEKQGGRAADYAVIEWRLPNDAKVAIIGDWGTGMPDARALLADIMWKHKPDAIIHLGDIYYSGTPGECQVNYARIITSVFDDYLRKGNRIPVFTLLGNHDYYALGYGAFEVFQPMNDPIPGARQEASYFCLRTEDAGWQFVGVDTGYFDHNPAAVGESWYAGPWLHESEAEWARERIEEFDGLTVLLSHHQLFSAHSRINGRTSTYKNLPYLNPYLYRAFEEYFRTKIAAWLWGHEHNFVMYQNDLFDLPKGRLVGCSAYEEAKEDDPYKVNFPEVPYLDPTDYRLEITDGWFNHGYAIVDLGRRAEPTAPVHAEYYQFPSWGKTAPQDIRSTLIHQEDYTRPVPPSATPLTYGRPLELFAEEAMWFAPLEKRAGGGSYPTLSNQRAVKLAIVAPGGGGFVKNGDLVQIKTLEDAAGSHNLLGAWPATWLYYWTSGGHDEQLWTIQKRHPTSDPVIHYDDEVFFLNKHYAKQWLRPLWSRIYGKTYLTTKLDAPYYWKIRHAPLGELVRDVEEAEAQPAG